MEDNLKMEWAVKSRRINTVALSADIRRLLAYSERLDGFAVDEYGTSSIMVGLEAAYKQVGQKILKLKTGK